MLKRTQSLSWKKTSAKSLKEVPTTEGSHTKYKSPQQKAVTLSTKKSKATKKNSWVGNDLRKSPKRKCFEENRAVWDAKKNTITKNWVEEDLRKFP